MGKVMKAALVLLILLVVVGFVFGLVETRKNFDTRVTALEQKLNSYEVRKDKLTHQQTALEAAQQELSLRIDRAVEERRQIAIQDSIRAQNEATEQESARLEAMRQEAIRQAELEAARKEAARLAAEQAAKQRQQEILAKQEAARTTRAS